MPNPFNLIKCPVCGKKYIAAPYHGWFTANGKQTVCSYSCQRVDEKWRDDKERARQKRLMERKGGKTV